jgi:hypothetical protein
MSIDCKESIHGPAADAPEDNGVALLTIDQIRTACERSEPVVLGDPVSARVNLPFKETFYPLGFPLEVETNSEEILIAMVESWQGFMKLFDTPPFRLRVCVQDSSSSDCPPRPIHRVQQHFASGVADSENFSITDFSQGFSSVWLTRAAVANQDYCRYFFLESAALSMICTSYTTPIHAACVDLEGCGVLLCGDSGAGKSTLSYACAQAGWTYITDDASYLVNSRQDRLVVGNSNQARFRPAAQEFFQELSGRPVTKRGDVGKPSIELKTSSLRNIATSYISRVNHVVFLNRREVKRQVLEPFPTEVARYFMLQRLYGLPDTMKVQSAMIDRVLWAGALELRYSSLDWAIERLGRLAVEGE